MNVGSDASSWAKSEQMPSRASVKDNHFLPDAGLPRRDGKIGVTRLLGAAERAGECGLGNPEPSHPLCHRACLGEVPGRLHENRPGICSRNRCDRLSAALQ